MMKKKIGERRRVKAAKPLTPLTTTGEKRDGLYRICCVETWNAKKVTLDMVIDRWHKAYPPEGYGTTVTGEVKGGMLTTTMTCSASCD